MVAQGTLNPWVGGSTPLTGTNFNRGLAERLKATVLKTVGLRSRPFESDALCHFGGLAESGLSRSARTRVGPKKPRWSESSTLRQFAGPSYIGYYLGLWNR